MKLEVWLKFKSEIFRCTLTPLSSGIFLLQYKDNLIFQIRQMIFKEH